LVESIEKKRVKLNAFFEKKETEEAVVAEVEETKKAMK